MSRRITIKTEVSFDLEVPYGAQVDLKLRQILDDLMNIYKSEFINVISEKMPKEFFNEMKDDFEYSGNIIIDSTVLIDGVESDSPGLRFGA